VRSGIPVRQFCWERKLRESRFYWWQRKLKKLQAKMEARGWRLEWERLRGDLDKLEEFIVRNPRKTFLIRSQTLGDVGKALQAVGVALGPTVRPLEGETPERQHAQSKNET
jgi:hypothetical protein